MICGACLIVALALSGCAGGDGSSDSRPGNQTAYQQDSSNCSSQFVSDYNQVASSLRYARTYSDLDQAQSLVLDFGKKYQGVVCQAALHSANRLDETPTTITVDSQVGNWSLLISTARDQRTRDTSNSNPALSKPITTVTPPATDRDTTISSMNTRIILQVVDAEAFNRFANSGASVLIQSGQGTTTHSLDLGCLKLSNRADDWKVRDLDKVFSGVAKVISID